MAKFTRKRKSAEQQPQSVEQRAQSVEQRAQSVEQQADDVSISPMIANLKNAFMESQTKCSASACSYTVQLRLPAECEPMYKSLPNHMKRAIRTMFAEAIKESYKMIKDSE